MANEKAKPLGYIVLTRDGRVGFGRKGGSGQVELLFRGKATLFPSRAAARLAIRSERGAGCFRRGELFVVPVVRPEESA